MRRRKPEESADPPALTEEGDKNASDRETKTDDADAVPESSDMTIALRKMQIHDLRAMANDPYMNSDKR